MSPKRPPAPKAPAGTDRPDATDEWGIYDPAKAGMPALYARLGRPVLRAAPRSARAERRLAARPPRSAEGVGLAILEARRRAGLDSPLPRDTIGSAASAMRQALKAQAAAAVEVPAAPFVPPVVVPPPVEPQPVEPPPVVADAQESRIAKKRPTKKAPAARAATPTPAEEAVVTHVAAESDDTATERPRRPVKGRAKAATPPSEPVVAKAPAPRPGPPAPSPRRPRGPVPLAAWARAVSEAPAPEPRRSDRRGFWRGVFRIPPEVALVEYAHGCRIHRLLIEAASDRLPDFI